MYIFIVYIYCIYLLYIFIVYIYCIYLLYIFIVYIYCIYYLNINSSFIILFERNFKPLAYLETIPMHCIFLALDPSQDVSNKQLIFYKMCTHNNLLTLTRALLVWSRDIVAMVTSLFSAIFFVTCFGCYGDFSFLRYSCCQVLWLLWRRALNLGQILKF